jgi:hypothetical protein
MYNAGRDLLVSTALKIRIGGFAAVTPSSLVGGHRRFGETCRLHLRNI